MTAFAAQVVLVTLGVITPLTSDISGADPVSFFINYGVAGAVVFLLVTGQLRTKAEVEGLKAALIEATETIKAKDRALAAIVTQLTTFLPQLAKVGEVVEALPHSPESQLLGKLEELASKLEAIQSTQGR